MASKKIYVNAGQLRKALLHCDDEDSVWIEFDNDSLPYLDRLMNAMQEGEEPLDELRIVGVQCEGGCRASYSGSRYHGSCTLVIEWDHQKESKYMNNNLKKKYLDGIQRNENIQELHPEGV